MMDDPLLFQRVARQIAARLRDGPQEMPQPMPQGVPRGKAVLITSARPGEGKTFVARELTVCWREQQDEPVVLVDCSATAAPATGGEGDRVTLHELLAAAGQNPAAAEGAAALFRIGSVTRVLEGLRSRYGLLVLDGPVLANCGVLGVCADGCVLVINADVTRREIVKGTLQANPVDPKKLLGAILNQKRHYVPRWLYRRVL